MGRSSFEYDEPLRPETRPASGLRRFATAILSLVLIPALLIAALLLPPISLLERIQGLSSTAIDRNGGSLMDPDGMTIVFPPEGVIESFRVSLDSIPRAEFLDGNAGEAWLTALNALSAAGLEAKSPIYQVEVQGGRLEQSIVRIPIPNDSQPYETLELYSWDGDSWEFVPSAVLAVEDRIEARLGGPPPSNFIVMQTSAPPARVGTNIGVGEQPPASLANAAITTLAVGGYYLRGDGALDVVRTNPPAGNYAIVPVLRNWQGDAAPRSDLLHNMLVEPGQLQNQLTAIANLLTQYSYPGVIIDYRGMETIPAGEAEFTHFIEQLAERLHAPDMNRWLAVRVEWPQQISTVEWNTRGYDWKALGGVADRVLIPGPADPAAYQLGGQMGALLAFATDQIDRSKVQVELPGMSVERSGNQLWLKGFQQSLQPLVAQIHLSGVDGVIVPGADVEVAAVNPRITRPLAWDDAIGAYVYAYTDDQQMERTVTIENSSSFARKLNLLERYEVTQVMVRDADSGDVDPALWEVARQFQTGGGVNTAPTMIKVSYKIFHPDGGVMEEVTVPIENPVYTFMAPAGEGDIHVEAQVVQISNLGSMQAASPQNTVAMSLATPTPVATNTPVPTPTPEAPRVVSTQNVNVREGPGTNYRVVTQLKAGQPYLIFGKNDAGTWWQIDIGNGNKGWVFAELTTASGPLNTVGVITDIPDPPAAAPAAAAPPPAGGGGFGYGVQAHMVHNNYAGRVMQETQKLGFGWVKQQIEWKVFEQSQGQYDWGSMQGIIDAANNAGISLLFSVVNAPAWAREANFERSVGGPPADPNTFARFLGAMAGKYCGTSLKAIEVWNEQNLHYEWGNLPLDPGKYVALLRPAYAEIKKACPQMFVISGALTPAASNGATQSRGGIAAMDDFEYLEKMFQAGLNSYMDGIGAHPSGYNVPPQYTWQQGCEAIQKHGNSGFNGACDSPHHSWSFRSTMEGYRNIAVKYGAGNKRIWPTEFGWAAGGAFDPRYGYANDNDFNEQAAWTVEAFQMMKRWGWVGPAILWNLNFRVVADGTEKAQWGIVRNDWSPLPIFHALRDMPK